MKLEYSLLQWIPRPGRRLIRKYLQNRDDRRNSGRSTREVFSEIYKKKLWARDNQTSLSGPGSSIESITRPYLQLIREALERSGRTNTVVDLGCGDMNISRHFLDCCSQFVGVDVVPDLIHRHKQQRWNGGNTRFECLDIVEDELPKGDMALLRQVLQHLSNDQILKILPKLRAYKVCFVTEHQAAPNPNLIPNKDLVHGLWNRVPDNSGVFLDRPPFNVPNLCIQQVLEVPGRGLVEKIQGVVRTYKIEWNLQ